ncbi:MAG: hypothetical protein WCO06_04465, partial [Candidatus Roizmanbacteria bacterium]
TIGLNDVVVHQITQGSSPGDIVAATDMGMYKLEGDRWVPMPWNDTQINGKYVFEGSTSVLFPKHPDSIYTAVVVTNNGVVGMLNSSPETPDRAEFMNFPSAISVSEGIGGDLLVAQPNSLKIIGTDGYVRTILNIPNISEVASDTNGHFLVLSRSTNGGSEVRYYGPSYDTDGDPICTLIGSTLIGGKVNNITLLNNGRFAYTTSTGQLVVSTFSTPQLPIPTTVNHTEGTPVTTTKSSR